MLETLTDEPTTAAVTTDVIGTSVVTMDVAEPAELVAALVEVWQAVLRLSSADADTNFFTNGGDSMLAARLVARIKKNRGVKISMRTVFRAPTPAALAAEIQALA